MRAVVYNIRDVNRFTFIYCKVHVRVECYLPSCFHVLEQLTKCNVGFKMLTMNVCSPTVADDMVLLALLLLVFSVSYAFVTHTHANGDMNIQP